jgi:hypothetical protein
MNFPKFKRFNPRTMRDMSTVLFVGGRRSGKSMAMRAFMYEIRSRVYDGHVWSGTYDEDHPWGSYFPTRGVHYCTEEFQEDALDETLRTQKQRKEIGERYGLKCPPSILVFEDLEFIKPSIWSRQGTRALIFNGRWLREFCFVAYQYIMEVKLEMRGSFDYAVFTMENSKSVRERIWKQFAGVFESFDAFEAAFKQLTKDWKVMVIDMRCKSYDPSESVFWYKADPDLPVFKVGHRDSWIGNIPAPPPVIKDKSEPKQQRKGRKKKST